MKTFSKKKKKKKKKGVELSFWTQPSYTRPFFRPEVEENSSSIM